MIGAWRWDRLVLLVAGLLFVGSALWHLQGEGAGAGATVELVPGQPMRAPVVVADEARSERDAPATFRWQLAARRDDFTLFASPRVEYNVTSGRLQVRARRSSAEESPEGNFGVVVRQLVAEPFRLQLVGFSGDADACRGVFVDQRTGEVLLSGAPEVLEGLGLEIRSLQINRIDATPADDDLLTERAAVAVVFDQEAGREVTLISNRPYVRDATRVELVDLASGQSQRVLPGTTVTFSGVRYRVDRLRGDSTEVEVTREEPGHEPETRWLRPQS